MGNGHTQTFYWAHLSGEARPVSGSQVRQNRIPSAHLPLQSKQINLWILMTQIYILLPGAGQVQQLAQSEISHRLGLMKGVCSLERGWGEGSLEIPQINRI